MLHEKNVEMMWTALKEGVDSKKVKEYLHAHGKEFFHDLHLAFKSGDPILRLLGLDLANRFLAQFDQEIEEVAHKAGVPKGIALFILVADGKGFKGFDQALAWSKQEGVLSGPRLVEALLEKREERLPMLSPAKRKKAVKGKRI